ncbi:unnamed protein product, partial [Cladocopium goreaui]
MPSRKDSEIYGKKSGSKRAADQGGAILSVQGITWILLRAIGISDPKLIQLLAPFNGLFPSTEAEYTQLKTNLRRMGHILERTPGNLRDGLRSSQIASSAFLTHDEPWNPEPTQWGACASETHGWSGESAFAASASCSSVDAFATFQDDDIDTDSNTSSGECSSIPDDGQDPNAVAQRLFWAYKQAKHKWRKYMGKSTRAVRRYAKRFDRKKGKGKGKSGKSAFPVGKGKGKKGKHLMTAMLAEMTDDEVQQALPAFRGNRSPGKGKTDASLRSVQAPSIAGPQVTVCFISHIEHARGTDSSSGVQPEPMVLRIDPGGSRVESRALFTAADRCRKDCERLKKMKAAGEKPKVLTLPNIQMPLQMKHGVGAVDETRARGRAATHDGRVPQKPPPEIIRLLKYRSWTKACNGNPALVQSDAFEFALPRHECRGGNYDELSQEADKIRHRLCTVALEAMIQATSLARTVRLCDSIDAVAGDQGEDSNSHDIIEDINAERLSTIPEGSNEDQDSEAAEANFVSFASAHFSAPNSQEEQVFFLPESVLLTFGAVNKWG